MADNDINMSLVLPDLKSSLTVSQNGNLRAQTLGSSKSRFELFVHHYSPMNLANKLTTLSLGVYLLYKMGTSIIPRHRG